MYENELAGKIQASQAQVTGASRASIAYGPGALSAANSQANAEESLASILPRIIGLSETVAAQTHKIANTLGVGVPESKMPEMGQPVPITVLRITEIYLRDAMGRLDSIDRHING